MAIMSKYDVVVLAALVPEELSIVRNYTHFLTVRWCKELVRNYTHFFTVRWCKELSTSHNSTLFTVPLLCLLLHSQRKVSAISLIIVSTAHHRRYVRTSETEISDVRTPSSHCSSCFASDFVDRQEHTYAGTTVPIATVDMTHNAAHGCGRLCAASELAGI